jgi:hypothetical protein
VASVLGVDLLRETPCMASVLLWKVLPDFWDILPAKFLIIKVLPF